MTATNQMGKPVCALKMAVDLGVINNSLLSFTSSKHLLHVPTDTGHEMLQTRHQCQHKAQKIIFAVCRLRFAAVLGPRVQLWHAQEFVIIIPQENLPGGSIKKFRLLEFRPLHADHDLDARSDSAEEQKTTSSNITFV